MSTSQPIHKFERAILQSDIEEDWVYLSEGNKHIVFQRTKTDGILGSLILKINKNINEKEGIFASNYMTRKWLGNEYVNQVIYPIHLSQSFVLKLIHKIQHQRPIQRRKKHSFEIASNNKNGKTEDIIYHASLESDACAINNEYKQNDMNMNIYTFDMKAKWMFMNISPFIEHSNIRKHICRFSMHQQLKYTNKSIERISKYCPLSLLSNDINVISNNLKHLLNAEQSNFKIFDGNIEMKCYKSITEYHIKTVVSVIMKHKELFKRISMLQRLDKFDICVIYEMWMELKSRNKLDLIQCLMDDTKILDEIVNELHKEYKKTEFGTETCFCCYDMDRIKSIIKEHQSNCKQSNTEISKFVTKLTDKELSIYIIEYLLSSIFKDCQILITLDFNNIKNHKITVIDLNSKPMERIQNKWLHQDIEIVANYIKLFSK